MDAQFLPDQIVASLLDDLHFQIQCGRFEVGRIAKATQVSRARLNEAHAYRLRIGRAEYEALATLPGLFFLARKCAKSGRKLP